MPWWAEPRGICTVLRSFVCLFVSQSLCLGGRSHEAFCNRVVCLSFCLSVTLFLQRTLNGEL